MNLKAFYFDKARLKEVFCFPRESENFSVHFLSNFSKFCVKSAHISEKNSARCILKKNLACKCHPWNRVLRLRETKFVIYRLGLELFGSEMKQGPGSMGH